MGTIVRSSHIVVTPSRNESTFLPDLIASMSKQTVKPSKWIIVDHNSTDSTSEIVSEAMRSFAWIEYILIEDDSERKRGAQIARLFNLGISIANNEWDFCSKIDADMILPENYFEKIFNRFNQNHNLGIASGSCFVMNGKKKKLEFASRDHTRGGLKTYRRECYEDIGGIREIDGWDGVDNILAQMSNWETRHFPHIEVHHQRITGSYYGLLRGCFEVGKFSYSMRYFPPFIIARSIHRSFRKPIILGGISLLLGFIWGALQRIPPVMEREEQIFIRTKQKRMLLQWYRYLR